MWTINPVTGRPVLSRPARIFMATSGTQRGSYPVSVALAVDEVLFCRLNKFTLVYFSLLEKPWMVLLAYSSAYSSSPTWLIPRRISGTYSLSDFLIFIFGKLSWALIGKRLVGNMTPESEVRFGPIFTSPPLFIWKACTPSFAPSLLKQLLFYTLPRVVPLSQSPLPVLYGSTVCYCPRRFCWNTVVKRGYCILPIPSSPFSTPLVLLIMIGMAAPPRGRYSYFYTVTDSNRNAV
jgi:hypothetical protein